MTTLPLKMMVDGDWQEIGTADVTEDGYVLCKVTDERAQEKLGLHQIPSVSIEEIKEKTDG
ncbi:MAG: hypothetical protein BWY50_02032 [Spirochaetes bacterium ADurb.Bin315]|nr:MAG: hypothetical protein BWY50_02032 [Spirochaetes bacterium ADurb.Bin315]